MKRKFEVIAKRERATLKITGTISVEPGTYMKAELDRWKHQIASQVMAALADNFKLSRMRVK